MLVFHEVWSLALRHQHHWVWILGIYVFLKYASQVISHSLMHKNPLSSGASVYLFVIICMLQKYT